MLKSINLDCGSEVVCIIFSSSSMVDILVVKGRETEGKTGRVTEGKRESDRGKEGEWEGGGKRNRDRGGKRERTEEETEGKTHYATIHF